MSAPTANQFTNHEPGDDKPRSAGTPLAPEGLSMLKPTKALRASWSSTLRLPRSSLPPRPPLPSPYLRCTDDLYAWQSEQRDRPSFVFHDGPPYANGSLHLGHALNKILKDMVCRFQITQGKRVQYIPGWDCHGLPIEVKALQALQKSHDSLAPVAIREAARALAEKTVEEQKHGFKQWAVMGDWDHPYRTMDEAYVLRQLAVFKHMVARDLINLELKPVYWSPSSGTALAEAELEYDDDYNSKAAFIRFPLSTVPDALRIHNRFSAHQLGALVWTTTPWTLPANQAVAVHKDLEYCVAQVARLSKSPFLLARSRLEYLQSMMKEDELEVLVESIPGSLIAGSTHYLNPLDPQSPRPVLHADFVSASSGTGLVHLAPGHGMDDYNVCQPLGVSTWAPVDNQGRFTEDAVPGDGGKALHGKLVLSEGSAAVLDLLQNLQSANESFGEVVLASHVYTHKYPIDWRTKQPVIIRATEQWFADVEHIKGDALRALDKVQYIPDTGKNRIQAFVQGRSQWCISRQRAWGVPIPALYRKLGDRREALMDTRIIDHILEVVKERGINAWWTDPEDDAAWVPDWLPPGSYERGKDTLDVWFDSGTSWTLLDRRPAGEPLADVYLEGTDQHRGWFQSSLLTHVASQQGLQSQSPTAPYKTLITHGFTLDQNGRKMSKSLGNVISPDEIINGTLLPPMKRKKKDKAGAGAGETFDALGPDALRLWVASSDYTRDIIIGQQVLQSVNQGLHKYRVTFKWLLGALSDFDPSTQPAQAHNPNQLIDEIALYQLSSVSQHTHAAYSNYEFFKAANAINKYINLDLSAFYFETLKDRLYTGTQAERVPAQQILYIIFNELLAMLGPITPLLVEEVWDHAGSQLKSGAEHPLRRVWAGFQQNDIERRSKELEAGTKHLLAVHSAIKTAQEIRRVEKLMGSSLECDVHILLPPHDEVPAAANRIFNPEMTDQLANIFVVSKVHVHRGKEMPDHVPWGVRRPFELESAPDQGIAEPARGIVQVADPSGDKCGRCWRYLDLDEEQGLCGRCHGVVDMEHSNLLKSGRKGAV
jgi:isoleucyl-tRNA synthetase